ncbi:MAG: carboxypeptidase regulatory-like domain-containing protein [Chloroflexi bacterium]|nr:carboxypeptidase regulatory-like domain-containing protein [Chloroflexota bacterium]
MTLHHPSSPATARILALVAAATIAILATGCSPATTPSPSSPSTSPSAAPSASAVTTPEAAAALVLASDARFTGLKAKNPDLIGGCCFYEVVPKGSNYEVMVEIGWGDCPAGCINRHHWFYTVTPAGTVTFDREDGPVVPAGVPGTGGDTTTGGTGGGGGDTGVAGIRGTAVAGPTCPVVSANDPNCADRPVAGATIHVIDASGTEVAQMTTDAAGAFTVSLPPGQYSVQADAVDGLMGAPPASEVVVAAAGMAIVQLGYDTGIR